MGTWTTKFRHPAMIAGVLAITLVANPTFAREASGSKRGGAGFASGAIVGGAAGGPIGAIVGATIGAVMGEHSQKKSETLARRKAETEALTAQSAQLTSQMETLNSSLSTIEGKAGQVGSTIQFRTGETGVRDSDKARLAKLGSLVAGLPDVRVRVSGFADARGDEALNLSLSQERAEMVARELEKAGVPKERMVVEAMGERFASTDAVADDQAFERCVEIRVESGQALASN
jgi:outer membrane protein OmpA-like peptidoglycan-associated protein